MSSSGMSESVVMDTNDSRQISTDTATRHRHGANTHEDSYSGQQNEKGWRDRAAARAANRGPRPDAGESAAVPRVGEGKEPTSTRALGPAVSDCTAGGECGSLAGAEGGQAAGPEVNGPSSHCSKATISDGDKSKSRQDWATISDGDESKSRQDLVHYLY